MESGSPDRVLTWANLLTAARILMIGPFLYFAVKGRFGAALCVFFIASVTDFFDGYLARNFHQFSTLGRFLDPAADKLLTTASYIALAVTRGDSPSIPVWLAVAVVGRDVAILTGALALYLARGFKEFRPTISGKINTFVELGLIVLFLAFNLMGRFTGTLPVFYWLALATIVVSGAEYLAQGLGLLSRPAAS